MAWEHSIAYGYLDLLERFRKFVCNIVDRTWSANTNIQTGEIVEPTTPNGYRYECITAGTTASTEPTWPTNIGDTVSDGTVVWKCIATKLPATQKWNTLAKTYDEVNGVDGELYLHAPDLDGTGNIYTNIKTYSNPASSIYTWILNTAIDYDPNLSFYLQAGSLDHITKCPKLNLHIVNINYWIIANGRRAILIADVNTYWFSMYMGLIKPYFPSSVYPYPYLLVGSHYDPKPASDVSNNGILSPTYYNNTRNSGKIRYIDGNFYPYYGGNTSSPRFYIWPLNHSSTSYPPNTDGSRLLVPCIIQFIAYPTREDYLIGELDGIYWLNAQNVSSGDAVTTPDGRKFLVFQNVENSSHFAAIELEE